MSGATPIRILYAEDNDGDVELLRIACADRRVDLLIEPIPDGDALLSRLAIQADPWPWSAVLIDLNLPGRTGDRLLAVITSTAAVRRIPVLVLTSSEWIGDRERALAMGAREVLVKPDTFTGYAAMLDRILAYCRTSN